MAIPRDTTKHQVSLDRNVYGSLPVEGLPEPTENADTQIALWHKQAYGAGQWVFVKLASGIGIDVDYDADTGFLTITNADYRKMFAFTADSYMVGAVTATFTADSRLLALYAFQFTADAELV